MDHKPNAQTFGPRFIVESLDREFARLYLRWSERIQHVSDEELYASIRFGDHHQATSIGERVLRSAAAIERTFGGLTANLWDDPFEWTLPEQLTTSVSIIKHLEEVDALRRRAFDSFTDDECLQKQVATPTGETRPLIDLLMETLINAVRLDCSS